MATFTKRGSRLDLLLTLARLVLPDALRRGDQAPVVAIGLALLYLAIATVSTLALLPLLFGIEDEALRRNLLILCACVVTLLWLVGQVVLRLPITWLLDLEDLLQLPVGYRDLYLLRLALSLLGYWLVGLGPAAIYVLTTRSHGQVHFVSACTAMLVLVLLLGRVTAILATTIDRLVESLIGLISLFLATAGAIYGAGIGIRLLEGQTEAAMVATWIRESAILNGAEYTPPGLLVAIVHSPDATQANMVRLGALLVLLSVAILLEHRLLQRQLLTRPGGDRRTASPVTPLRRILRGVTSLSPVASLTLVEIECAFRAKGVRWAYAVFLGYAMYASVDVYLGVLSAALLTTVLLHSVRTEKPPTSSLVWRESLTLPLPAVTMFRVPSRVPPLLAVPVVTLAAAVGFMHAGWSAWQLTALAMPLTAALLLLADGVYGLVQLYWPKRGNGGTSTFEPENLAASLLATLPLGAILGLSILLWRVAAEARNGPLIASISAVAVLLVAALAWRASTVRQRREIESRAHELLLRDQTEERPKPS